MGVLNVLLLVLFVIAAILLILIVLVQNEEGDSLGGIFAGGSGSAFGSRSGNVLTKTTTVLGAIFLVLSLSLALLNRSRSGAGVEAAGRQSAVEESGDWWQEGAPAPGGAADGVNLDLPFDLSGDGVLEFNPDALPPAGTGE
ncbi:MAG: preprotein translocase subunit SecG [Spirochaetaceae bacterium]|jgi:preprotein translocase subunit SecG|nr:preprotein translocase subunit SecG [Spirochaetaceae bacterium]